MIKKTKSIYRISTAKSLNAKKRSYKREAQRNHRQTTSGKFHKALRRQPKKLFKGSSNSHGRVYGKNKEEIMVKNKPKVNPSEVHAYIYIYPEN